MEEDKEQNSAVTQDDSENELLDGNRQNDVITVVLTADNHLGYAAFSQNPHKREHGRQRLRRAFQQVTDFAIGQGVDLFVQAGDLFDTTNPDEEDRSFVAERLAQLKQVGIRTFALGGIHDTPADAHVSQDAGGATGRALAPQISYARLGALHYFQPGGNLPPAGARFIAPRQADGTATRSSYLQPVMVDVRNTLLAICGLGVLADQEGDPLAQVRVDSDIERADIPLLILHAPLETINAKAATRSADTRSYDGQNEHPYHPHAIGAMNGADFDIVASVSNASIANQTAFHYILAGYHHSHHQLHIGQSEVIVAGATQHIDFNDLDDDPGFVFLGLSADGIRWCRHISVDTLKLRRLVINIAELWPQDFDTSDRGITDLILQRLEPLRDEDTLVQLRLEGELTRSQYHQLDLNQVRHFGEEFCFALAIDDSHLSISSEESSLPGEEVSSAALEERLSPREELIALADEWIAAAQDERERRALLATKEELLTALSFRLT
ncbi:MAG TPA: metallophosphoesterase [Ktedonobacteraceae bacterium]